MLKIWYAKNTYGPKCHNTHGPKLWLLDTWAWAHDLGPGPGPGPMCLSRRQRAEAPRPRGARPWAQVMPMCPGAEALAHEYFDIWAHKYV